MKNKNIRRICALLSVAMLSVSLFGCVGKTSKEDATVKPMEEESTNALSFDIIGGDDVMPIAGYYGPRLSTYSQNGEAQPGMINDEYYQAFSDCGINVIVYSPTDYEYTPTFLQDMLEYGEQYNIGHFVTDTKVSTNNGKMTLPEIAARVNEYANSPSFCGVHVCDEPYWEGVVGDGTRDMDDYAPAFEQLQELGINAASNLLPSWVFHSTEDFEKYVEKFITECPSPYISFDYYVFDEGRNVSEYFYNLSVYRAAAEKAGIPFWTFIQAGSQWNDSQGKFDSVKPYYPNENQFQWNINTSLAYGAKGIEYFPLIQPSWFAWAESTTFDFERNGILGAWGNKTQWYYYAQNINPHIAAIDEVLMNSANKGVIVSGEKAKGENALSSCVLEGTSWREMADISGDAMVGCFNYQGKTALYIVNYDMEYAQDITISFQDDYHFSVIQNAEKAYYNGDGIELSMRAGEGVLLVFE